MTQVGFWVEDPTCPNIGSKQDADGFNLRLNVGGGLDLPHDLKQALGSDSLGPDQYLNILRAWQAHERLFPGSRMIWSDLSAWVVRQSESGTVVEVFTSAYGELQKATRGSSNYLQSIRYTPAQPTLRHRNPYKGYERLTSTLQGHQRLMEKHGMLLTYTVGIDWLDGRTLLIPVDAIAHIRFVAEKC